ncbi:MAG TPA: CTP synthase, partial [Thermomicrobiaceae bacterium]|nr:CTP synthase [Thermomicrobiaceae bacterium]
IKERIQRVARDGRADVVIVEVGGTVGDIEGQPFLEAIRQMRKEAGRQNVLYIHVTLLPKVGSTGELKTKPTQHSVKELREIGIQPDVIVVRSDYPVPDEVRAKISLFGDVDEEAVIPLPTAETIYEVPLELEEAGLGRYLAEHFGWQERAPDLARWQELVCQIKQPKRSIRIALVGKYVELHDAYMSVAESLMHAGLRHGLDVEIVWVNSEQETPESIERTLRTVSGIVVPGGFGPRGVEGKLAAVRFAREHHIPYFGLCYGLHMAVIEFARNVLGFEGADSTEINPETPYPVIDLMPDQQGVDMGGTMRLGLWPCAVMPGTRTARAYGQSLIEERHRHRWEVSNTYRPLLEEAGLVVSGASPDGTLAEIMELRDHPWFVGVQFHPEFKSRPTCPHPLFSGFMAAAKDVLHEGDQRPLPLEDEAVSRRVAD